MVPCPMELTTDFHITSNKLIRVGLYEGVPTVAFIEKKSCLYLDTEEWSLIEKSTSRIRTYFEKKKLIDDDDTQVRCKNLVLNFTKRGRNRVIRLDHSYPWITLMNHSPSPHLTITSPAVCFNKSESAKLSAKVDKISDMLCLMDKVAKVYCRHVNGQQTDPLNLSLNTNTLFNNLFNNSSLFKDVSNK